MHNDTSNNDKIRLIVNADDFGYFWSISRGILDAAREGVVSATGIMANGPCFNESVNNLVSIDSLDLGVHLNLTYGKPLSEPMRQTLWRYDGEFPGKLRMAVGIMTGQIKRDTVRHELRLQIGRCLDRGLTLRFLNSHEHIHMLPPIYEDTLALAAHYNIPFVRHMDAEWGVAHGGDTILRNLVFQLLGAITGSLRQKVTPPVIGLAASGRLSINYLKNCFQGLAPGDYELMCHPGHLDEREISDSRLLEYHRWDAEYDTLVSEEFVALLNKFGIEVVGFRDVVVS